MSILMRDYELSIWDNSKNEENKIAIIGSPEIFSKARAQEVTLTRNTNGTKSLNFYLYFEYIDTDGEKKVNPYYSLLNTDTKLKLKWKERWYEFVIKSISETTENKKIEYVAEDAFITELSKRGFDVELSTDLENNQGSIFELGERILEKSEWTINKEKSNVKPQIIKDVLVKLKTTSEIKPERKVELDEDDLLIENSNSSITIPKGKIIYTFYPTLKKKEPYFQFYYLESEKYEISDDGFLINCPLYIVEDCKYTKENPYFAEKQEITTSKGKRLIRSQKSYYNSKLKKYVKVYSSKNGSEQIGGYTETEYLTDNFVTNLVTNSTDFINDIGWYSVKNNEIEVTSYPNNDAILKILTSGEEIETINYLKLNFDKLNQPQFYNTGIDDNKKLFSKGLYSGQKFVIKLDFGFSKDATLTNFPSSSKFNKTTKVPYSCLKVALATYNYNEDGEPEIEKVLFETNLTNNNDSTFRKVGNYYTAICSNQQKFSQTQLLENNLGVFFSYETTSQSSITNDNIEDYYFYIKDFQIFEYKEKSDGTYYSPNEVLDGEAKIKYSYFYENQEYTTSEDIEYLSQSYSPQSYDEVYYDNFMQIRTIEQKESNYFNLLQTLAETFECWVDFLVEHDEQGYLTLNSEKRPKKEIVFKPFLGKKNWAGFRKGVNLKQVNREINNSQIITKTIVKPNNNEFAPYGFCTIAYSTENPSGESFIYDFSFYENKKLIDKDLLKARLYEKNGLYPTLKKINNELEDITNKYTAKSLEIIHLKSQLQILETQINELSVEIATAKKDFRVYSGITYKRFLSEDEEFKTEYLQLSGVSDAVVIIVSNTSKLKKIKEEAKRNRQNLEAAEQEYKELDEKIKKLTLQKEEEIFNFEINYSSYIREGVWVSEDYVDHDLYYADAKVIASTSANPQITYNIDVIDVSGLEEFLNYDFDLGDKTYIIDPEFFGYVEINNQKTPRRQEVVVTEIKEVLESPEANKLVIQNYKTQFEDLFQRITATTQQLKLNEGVYNRAAKAFDYNGLTSEVTENSLNNNNFNLTNSSITWAEDGIITSNMTNNHEAIKIANGSIFTSENSENAWASMITPKGINANYIYTGQLDAGVINIVTELKKDENDNLEYAVTMDKDGISMYSYSGKKVPRLRLGKILELNTEQQSTEELYGLQLYNKEGQQTFRTDSNGDITMTGTIHAKDGSFSGTISAKQGIIGGWTIDDAALTHKTLGVIDSIITTQKLDARYTVNSFTTDDWRLIFGLNGIKGNFGVNSSGNLFANGVDIKDGNINFGDIFKITSGKDENGNGDTLTYGLNIKLSKENEDKEVVIESDDRVIGIREKVKDENGNVLTDENGQDKWTWKTILGDLTNATLGKDKLSDLGLTGYGLCTENGLFSGTIIATSGEIGGWKITEKSLFNGLSDANGNAANGISLGTETDESLNFYRDSFFGITLIFSDKETTSLENDTFYLTALNREERNYDFSLGNYNYNNPPSSKFTFYNSPKFFFPRIDSVDQLILNETYLTVDGIRVIEVELSDIIVNIEKKSLVNGEIDGEEGLLVTFGLNDKLKNILQTFIENDPTFQENMAISVFYLDGSISTNNNFGSLEYKGGFKDTDNGEVFNYKISESESENITSYKDFIAYSLYGKFYDDISLVTGFAARLLIRNIYNKIRESRDRVFGSRFQIFKEGKNIFSIDNYGSLHFNTEEENKEGKFKIDISGAIAKENIENTEETEELKIGTTIINKNHNFLQSKIYTPTILNSLLSRDDYEIVSAWELFSSYNCKTETDREQAKVISQMTDKFYIGSKTNNIFKPIEDEKEDGKEEEQLQNNWIFENRIFYEDNQSENNQTTFTEEKSLFYSTNNSDLGTLENPWGDLYLKHYGKIFSFTKEGKKVQLLYVSSGNNITIGYKEKDKNVANDTNLHTGDIGLYAQTVNVKNDLSVVGNLTASKINEIKPYYGPGDSIIFDNNFVWTGYLSTGRNTIYFSIPLDKPLLPNTEVNLSGAIQMRGHGNSGGGYIINLNRANASTSPTSAFTTGETGVTFTYQEKNGYLIVKVTSTATLTKYSQLGDSTATYETINNTPLAICPTSGTKLTLTFTKASS